MEKRPLYIATGEWLEDYKRNSVKALTYDRLVISYRLLRKYPISEYPVNDISTRNMQRYLNDLVVDGYGMSTIKKQYNLLTAYWKFGMAQGEIEHPIYLGVNLPNEESLSHLKKEIEAYSHSEQRKLMDIFQSLEKPQYAVAILMLETGMRVGEALGLRWDDILWSRKAISINSTLIRLSSKPGVSYVQNSPKSKTSRRTIPLSDTACKVLEKLHDDRDPASEWIFPSRRDPDQPMSYSSLERVIRLTCKDLGIPYRGLHAFRHTFATNCYENGCDVKILSKLLGHADVAITYNIYIHLYGDSLEEMRKALVQTK